METELLNQTILENKKKEYKRFILANLAILVIGVIFFLIFIYKNYQYIIDPKSSPYYDCGAPFGDGSPEFEFLGIQIPSFAIKLIFTLNIFFYFANFYDNGRILMGASLGISAITSLAWFIDFFLFFPALYIIPFFAGCIIFFAIKKNKRGLGHSIMVLLANILFIKLCIFYIYLTFD